jgi:phosphoribosyl 1,2-cyclic phosphodiesterase
LTLRFASLGSGSRGNALLVESAQTLVLVDCGLTLKAIEERLSGLGRDPRDIDAVLITHEHSDHVRGVSAFARRYRTPVRMTAGTAAGSASRTLPRLETFNCHRQFEIGDISVEPFPVPHDAREPCQFVFANSGRRLGILSDTGHITPHIKAHLAGCDAMALEFNHDVDALWAGDYPQHLKQRIASQVGHLNNMQAAELLSAVVDSRLQWVVALHLSESNNSQGRVRETLQDALGADHSAEAHLAQQHEPSSWLEVV